MLSHVWRLLLLLTLATGAFVNRPPSFLPRQCAHWLMAQSAEADAIQTIKACRSIRDVDRVLAISEQYGPHAAAAALRRMTDLLSRGRASSEEDRAVARAKIPALLETVGSAVLLDIQQQDDDSTICLNPNALADILVSLAKLGEDNHMEKMVPLATRVCELMDRYESKLVYTLGPTRLIECIESLATLQLHHDSLMERMCNRLQKGDAVGQLHARRLSSGLLSFVRLQQDVEQHDGVIQAFLRRWRKQAVRRMATTRDICQTLSAARQLARSIDSEDALHKEAETMVYTLLRELYCPSTNATRLLTAGQVSEIMMTASAFRVNGTNPIFDHVLSEKSVLKQAAVADISGILLSMERLGLSRYPLVVRSLGLHLFELFQMESGEPKYVNTILRSALFLHGRDQTVMDPYVNAITFLVLEGQRDESSFLSACSSIQLSNYAWFLSRLWVFDEEVLITLANRILDPDILESCSPKSACRILSSYTSLIDSSDTETEQMRSILSRLFHDLGTHLLSSQLTPAETSAALQAYAKSSYVHDMGIFDHLANHLSTLLDECTIRQVVQSLWSCGKMMVWESGHNGDELDSGPPYLAAAHEYVVFLASRVTQLTAKDVSQTIWACNRLGIDNVKHVCAFAYRARQVASECTSQEIASILWGLSGLGFDDGKVVSALTDRMAQLEPSSQEAATVLYALGRMGMRDEAVFSSMSSVMMGQLETASAQAIANALWAYRTLHISPPRALLDTWAIEKLGMTSVQTNSRDIRDL